MPIRIEQVPIESETGILLMAIRMKVFVEEQGVPIECEIDAYDNTATHLAAFHDDEIAGTCRLITKARALKIGRVAVLKEYRLQGIGRALMQHAIQFAHNQKCTTCELTAQLPVIPFYEKLGFTAHGKEFMEVNIPHRAMTLQLTIIPVSATAVSPIPPRILPPSLPPPPSSAAPTVSHPLPNALR